MYKPLNSLLIVLAFGLLSACGGPTVYAVTGSARAPGADGTITLEDLGGNRLATVELNNLPPPDRLGNGLTTYIVWFQEQNGSPTKAGSLQYDPDERSGQMQATTPSNNRMTIIVTAERNANAQTPSDVIILRKPVG
ncbi:MAG: hypothetical protein OEY14_08420 [Myxococcales bacterium]|nr:hypothetical protein [Myxococcales bacterium]